MKAVALLLVVVVCVTTGCATVWSPTVPSPTPGPTAKPKCETWATVNGSLGCAAEARRAMSDRADDQAMVPRVIGAILIPFSAAIAGLAMTGTTGVPITALTLGGVTLMGEGIWLTNAERRRVYRVGDRAVQCVITTMYPFGTLEPRLKKFEDDGHNLGLGILKMDQTVADASAKLAAAKARFAVYSALMTASTASGPARTRAAALPEETRMMEIEETTIQEVIAAARQALATARHVDSRAQALLTRMYGAPVEIRTSVDQIISLVNEQIDQTEPTMEGVRQALAAQNQLRTSAFEGLDALIKASQRRMLDADRNDAAFEAERAKIRATPRAKAAMAVAPATLSKDEADALKEWEEALSALRKARVDLVNAEGRLTAQTSTVSKEIDAVRDPALAETCVTTAKSGVAAKPLKIDFQRPDQTVADPVVAGESVVFIVSGGAGEAQISAADADSKAALEIGENTVSGVKVVTVKVKSDAKAGTYLVDVSDKVSSKVVKIVVKAAALAISGTDADTVKLPAAGTTGVALFLTVTGGTGTCEASLDPATGFLKPQTSPTAGACTIAISWGSPLPTVNQVYTLNVKWGLSGARKFKVTN